MISSLTKTYKSTFERLWPKFASSKKFRDNYVAAYVKRSIPAQIRALMKKGGLSQNKLAALSGVGQGVISRAANPKYGDLTLNTIIRIGAGFDCAFIGKYVPFTEFIREMDREPEATITAVPSFEKENEEIQQKEQQPGSADTGVYFTWGASGLGWGQAAWSVQRPIAEQESGGKILQFPPQPVVQEDTPRSSKSRRARWRNLTPRRNERRKMYG